MFAYCQYEWLGVTSMETWLASTEIALESKIIMNNSPLPLVNNYRHGDLIIITELSVNGNEHCTVQRIAPNSWQRLSLKFYGQLSFIYQYGYTFTNDCRVSLVNRYKATRCNINARTRNFMCHFKLYYLLFIITNDIIIADPHPMNMQSRMMPVRMVHTIITGMLNAIHVAKFTEVGSSNELNESQRMRTVRSM